METPRDFIGQLLHVLFQGVLSDEVTKRNVANWNMSVVIDTDFYPVTLNFENGLNFVYGEHDSATLRVQTTIEVILWIVEGRTSVIKAVLSRKIKIQGFLQHPRAAFRFYRLLSSAIGG